MQISLKWINDYVNIENYFSKPQELADLLTNTGLEVEEVSDLGKRYASIVIGQILKLDKHPDADRLTVCQVETGSGSVQQIVCGAKNHKQGDKVMVALPGAVLPGDFAIKQSVIRGVESSGMLCFPVYIAVGYHTWSTCKTREALISSIARCCDLQSLCQLGRI